MMLCSRYSIDKVRYRGTKVRQRCASITRALISVQEWDVIYVKRI